jgi:mannosyltransferase OCH1-like enzyme
MDIRIYYVWVGNSEMPDQLKRYIDTWQKIKDAKIIHIGNECEDIESPFLKWAFENGNWCNVSNYMRAYAMYNWGGIYMDTDVEIVRDSEVWRLKSVQLAKEMPNWLNSHVIVSHSTGHSLFKKMIDTMDLCDFQNTKEIELEAGPRLITRTIQEMGYDVNDNQEVNVFQNYNIHPERVFSPHRWNQKYSPSEVKPDTLAIHHFTKLW